MSKKREANWERNYLLLCQFIDEYGRLPSINETYCDRNIGSWYAQQKTKLKNTDYPKDHKEKLDVVIKQELELKNQKWEKNYQVLCQFIKEYGRPPSAKETYCDCKIGSWYVQQKTNLKKTNYPKEHKEKLDAVVKQELEYKNDEWEKSYQLLCQFIEEYGRLPIAKEQYDGKNIATWYHYQKQNLNMVNYPKEHRTKIEQLSTCPTTADYQWEQQYQMLEKFVEAFGRLPMEGEVYENVLIGRWYQYHRHKSKDIDYPEWRRKKIEEINTHPTIADTKWGQCYQLLENFIKAYGRLPMAEEIYEGVYIGYWYNRQKHQCKRSNYPKERREKIEAMAYYPTVYDLNWEKHFCVLQKFIEEYGRLPKAKDIYENEQIGRWYQRQ